MWQEGRQTALYVAHEQGEREASGRQTSVNQLNFMLKYMYIGLGILGINPNVHKWHAPIIRLSMW